MDTIVLARPTTATAAWEPRPTVEHMSQPTSLGGLREHGYRSRSVKAEIRSNLLERLRSGDTALAST